VSIDSRDWQQGQVISSCFVSIAKVFESNYPWVVRRATPAASRASPSPE
jgi:hypothetical protein